MGIPGLFSSLKDKYTNIITQKYLTNLKFTVLLFDYNSMIHPINNIILSKYPNISKDEHEKLLIKETLEYTDKIINNINPEICGIFIDGVCPMAKMVQQRQRRYASIIDKYHIKSLYSKYNENLPREYNTNTISPGTEFMEQFHNSIIEHISKKIDIKYIYSSYIDIGEGEHKIMQYIKNNKEMLTNKNILIYGLDADLIILSMTLKEYNIYLLRENHDVPIASIIDEMIIFNIKECSKSIILELSSNQDDTTFNYIIDFVFISNILGNDFILPCPTVNLRFFNKVNGVDTIINNYKKLAIKFKTLNNNISVFMIEKINNTFKINWNFFTEYIKELSIKEANYFEKPLKKYYKTNNSIASEIENYNNLLAQKIINPIDIENNKIDYNLRKLRYIHYYFSNNVCECKGNDNIIYESPLVCGDFNFKYDDKQLTLNETKYNSVIRKYLTTFLFVMYYYFEGCPDNLFYYPFYSSILLSDLYKFLICEDKLKLNKLGNRFVKKTYYPIYPLQQLILILPSSDYNLLPKNICNILSSKNQSIYQYFFIMKYLPLSLNKLIRDKFNKSKLFQSLLVLDIPCIHEINMFIFNISLSQKDINRCLTINTKNKY